ncbi:putative bifunctional diguanylate cyclase/phosphodiesterase [Silanimonas lenta]|uniref:putative bifunctional diguanylate cyclase/phosphodiesterase n=1 Tax=Silanimonas lenta TaxID=265429 RepID=UPI00040619D7|nr:GGDEF domain-containing phosphodiesterase [Silanimonas lenta]
MPAPPPAAPQARRRRLAAALPSAIAAVPAWAAVPARSAASEAWFLVALLALALFVTLLFWSRGLRQQRRQAEQQAIALRRLRQQLDLVLAHSGDVYWELDLPGGVLHRQGIQRLVGPGAPDDIALARWREEAVHPDDLEPLRQQVERHASGETEVFESEHRLRCEDGSWRWVRARGRIIERDAAGRPVRMAGITRDIQALRSAERETRVAYEVFRSMSEAVSVVGPDFTFVAVNPAFSRITGYAEEEVLGKPASLLDSSQHSSEYYQRVRSIALRSGHWSGEMWQRRKDGGDFLSWIELSEVRDRLGQRTHFVAVVDDITQKKRAEQELRYLANYDTLTGLPNRTLLAERLSRAIIRARRQESRVAVLFIDLDHFKDINDSLGHAAGDRLLKAAAARLQAAVGPTDTVARLGGDEFTIIVEDLDSVAAAERLAGELIAAFAAPLEVDERHRVGITPSVGISLYPDHAMVPTDLLKFADTAMYQAKARGRNTFEVYDEAMDAESRRRATLLAALRRALAQEEFRLVFQPRFSLRSERVVGVEALLRWRSAELGEVGPAQFIPLAEESGLILGIGEWVLREACRTLRQWQDAGLGEIACSINVSVLQLLRAPLAEQLAAILAETGIAPGRIELELTESVVMQNAEQARAVLDRLRGLGVRLAIDDFGTGYSSLVYLKRLPIDTLKIDKEFIGDLTDDPDDKAITATVITMAHSLGLHVVAEGVETEAQLAYLRGQGCDEVQGYLLSPPLEAAHAFGFIRERQAGRRLDQPAA